MSDDNQESSKRKESESRSEAQEIKEIFGALNESIPKLIGGLISSVYSAERAEDMAAAIGGFYTKLKEQGIPEELALELTKKYVAGLDMFNITKLLSMAMESEQGVSIQIDPKKKKDEDEEPE
ncbi:MAG: hypothetical protein EAX95_05765 [Candidatus Thorarchaeota archaeon]|nr:hypothetical protein [Candidatus Thorarchaeota archaeon]